MSVLVFSISNLFLFRIRFSASWFLCWIRDKQKNGLQLHAECCAVIAHARIVLVNGRNYYFCHLAVVLAFCSFFSSVILLTTAVSYSSICGTCCKDCNCELHKTNRDDVILECVFVVFLSLLLSYPVVPCWVWNKPTLLCHCVVGVCQAVLKSNWYSSTCMRRWIWLGWSGLWQHHPGLLCCLYPSGNMMGLKPMHSEEINTNV